MRCYILAVGMSLCFLPELNADPLPSWNRGPVKDAILDFVATVTDESSDAYVEPAERIATFDNDGTLWIEQPVYVQFAFAMNRVVTLAPKHREWKTREPFRSILAGDMKVVAASDERDLAEVVLATHGGMTAEEFDLIAARWIATAKHPRFQRVYTELVYQPQLELLDYLRANGFKTFIVSGGGTAFMRPWTERVYGIPREQVIGSRVLTEFQIKDGRGVLVRQPKLDFVNDKAGKPMGILQHIGRRPILAFGNSDADMQMIQYTKAGDGVRLGLFIHHTDGEREYAYDRTSRVGRLDKVLDVANSKGWIIVDMKRDWKHVFPFEKDRTDAPK